MAKINRNQICPKCQKKMKYCQCPQERKRKYLWVGIMALIVIMILLALPSVKKINSIFTRWRIKPALQVFNQYQQTANYQDDWWLQYTSPAPPSEKQSQIFNRLIQLEQQLNTIVFNTDYNLTLLKKIQKSFHSVKVSIQIGNEAIRPIQLIGDYNPAQDIGVVYFPQAQCNEHQSDIYYDSTPGGLLINCAAFNWPEKIFKGMFLHELGHLYFHQIEKRPSATATQFSELYNEEEVIMHEFEAEIFNFETHGQYFQYLDQIRQRQSKTSLFSKLVNLITVTDCQKLEEILEYKNSGPTIKSLVLSQHYITLAFRQFDQRYDADKAEKLKKEFYLWSIEIGGYKIPTN